MGTVNDKENEMKNWIKDGEKITATHNGKMITGVVESSRVKLGGKVQYSVFLDTPVQYRWRTDSTNSILINHDEIENV